MESSGDGDAGRLKRKEVRERWNISGVVCAGWENWEVKRGGGMMLVVLKERKRIGEEEKEKEGGETYWWR